MLKNIILIIQSQRGSSRNMESDVMVWAGTNTHSPNYLFELYVLHTYLFLCLYMYVTGWMFSIKHRDRRLLSAFKALHISISAGVTVFVCLFVLCFFRKNVHVFEFGNINSHMVCLHQEMEDSRMSCHDGEMWEWTHCNQPVHLSPWLQLLCRCLHNSCVLAMLLLESLTAYF